MPNTDADRLAALVLDALVDLTSDHPWAEQTSAHVATVLTAAGVGFVAEAERERDEARATNDRLNRRVQIAEAAVHELTTGTGNGKARPVAAEMWARCQETHERHCPRAERAEAALADLRARVAPLARECQGLVSRYTRAPGENGDRVADLLSEDTHRIGTAILALLDAEPTP